jgi:hypothetical protein
MSGSGLSNDLWSYDISIYIIIYYKNRKIRMVITLIRCKFKSFKSFYDSMETFINNIWW